MSGERDITITVGNYDSLYLNKDGGNLEENWVKFQQLTDKQVISAFRWTARTLDQISYDVCGGGGSWDPKSSEYYRGLVELKKRADSLGLVLTGDKIYEDMTDTEKLFWGFNDPMMASYIVELLSSESSDII